MGMPKHKPTERGSHSQQAVTFRLKRGRFGAQRLPTEISTKIQVNLARVKFSDQAIEVFVRHFNPEEDRMFALKSALPSGWDAYMSGDKVYAWRFSGREEKLGPSWEMVRIKLEQEPGLFIRLLESGLTRYLERKGFELLRRKVPALVNLSTNLLDGALSSPLDRRVGIYPVYGIEGFTRSDGQGGTEVLLLVSTKTQWRLSIPVSELAFQGVDCTALGVRIPLLGVPESMQYLAGKSVGIVSRVQGSEVELSDPRDPNVFRIPADLVWPEGNRRSFFRYLQANHPQVAQRLWSDILEVDAEKSKPRELLQRVRHLIRLLGEEPISLADRLSVEIGSLLPLNVTGLELSRLGQTQFIFDYASKTVDTLASRGLRTHGPYDKSQPPFKKAQFLVLYPKPYEGDVRAFFTMFEEGCIHPDRQKKWHDFPGFSHLLRMGKPEILFETFDPTVRGSVGDSYEYALTEALRRVRKDISLCFVVTEEAHKNLVPSEDPYCIAKGLLFSHGIPVSELTIENAKANEYQLPFILSGMALQAYAKMGGVPFVLRADTGDRAELILGVGRADIGKSRFGRKRLIGFATVFKNNGDYLVGEVRPFKNPEDYTAELAEVIEEGLREAIQREGINPATPIRLIFHIYKRPGRGNEVSAVEAALQKFSDYAVEYAFVHVSDTHGWLLVDDQDQNGVPPRGLILELGPHSRLLTVIGPREYLKKGSPLPLKITIDSRSTYQDVERLSQQVFDFTNVSWRGFNIVTRPVTIYYAHLAAELAGKLEQTKYWQPTMFRTFLRDKKWFL